MIETELGEMATVGIVGRILAEGHLPGDRREMTSFATILRVGRGRYIEGRCHLVDVAELVCLIL